MNIGALPELLLSWLKSQGTEQQAAKDQAFSQFKPGAQYEGKVLDSLPNGRNLVQVGNQAMDMGLPKQARAGDVIRLTFLNAAPRPTFVLNSPAVTAAQAVNVSQAAQQVNALVRYVPVSASAPVPGVAAKAAPAGSAVAQSATAANAAAPAAARPIVANPAVLLAPAPTAVSAPLSAMPGPAIPGMAMASEAVEGMRAALGSQSSLATAQGVVAEKPSVSHVLPMRLQQTVKESGLFYESHLGKWVRGELSLESIQRQPQARLLQSPGTLLNLPDLEGMPEEAARLASRQLHMLEGGPFLWQGQAWPGQLAEWLVHEREGGDAEADAAGQKWHSRLRLTLPRLGEVSADLDIGALGLRIRLQSASPETLVEINAAMPELVQRMRSAELNLSSIQAELADGGR